MKNKDSIFCAYDIRGVYGKDLTNEIAGYIPASFLSIAPTTKVIIGRDARESSPKLMSILSEKFISYGVTVIDIGTVSTDMFYFACGSKKLPGIMITASHNPKEYNGFKLVKKLPHLISKDSGLEKIEKGVEDKLLLDTKDSAEIERENIMNSYIEKLFEIVKKESIKPLKVVVDAGNGMTGQIWTNLVKDIPIDLIPLYFEPDGSFPNHGPNPAKEINRKDIEDRVKKEGADVGFIFDADGDRCIMIDEMGNTVSADFSIALIAKEMIKQSKEKQKILYTVNTSQVVRDTVNAEGHEGIRERVGHPIIKTTMQKKNIIFGGEVSGHYYFKDFYFSDSGALAALIMLQVLSQEKKKLSDLVKEISSGYHITGEINFSTKESDSLIKELKSAFKDGKQDTLDGFSVEYPDWHANIRKSNTGESVVRLSIEAKTETLLKEKKSDIVKIINKYI